MDRDDANLSKAPGLRVWTSSVLGWELHVEGAPVARVRTLQSGGASAQWLNGMEWDVSDQHAKAQTNKSRHFRTEPEGKAAVEARLDEES
ncbi:MAG: hypothetical protein E6R08_00485 [Nevskiaceae bacterium]|nr:MAG: hypothetical protein E6R08_00485 [Nevskiaceae bacterium]